MIRVFRPINLLMIVLVCFAFQVVVNHIQGVSFQLTDAFVSYTVISILVAAGGYLINGYYDREIDQINHSGYQFPLNKTKVTFYYSVFASAAIIKGLISFDMATTVVFILFPILLLWLYSYWLKGLPLIGNGAVAFLALWLPVGLLHVNDASDQLGKDIASQFGLLLMGEIFLITLAREVIKDIQDIKGDRKHNCKTLAVRLGEKNTAMVATFFLFWALLLWFTTLSQFFSEINLVTIIFGVLTLLFVFASIATLWFKKPWSKKTKLSSLMLKIGMFAALLTLIFVCYA